MVTTSCTKMVTVPSHIMTATLLYCTIEFIGDNYSNLYHKTRDGNFVQTFTLRVKAATIKCIR